MLLKQIKTIYHDIFKSYDHPSLTHHIKKIIELDTYLPYSSTFFCITNTQNLTFEFISKNMTSCIGLEKGILLKEGMRNFWNRIHPEDVELWLKALNDLMVFTLEEISIEDRQRMSYTWNYRLLNEAGSYVNIIQNTTPLEFDSDMKPIIGLAHYTVLDPKIKMSITATAKLLNENNEYETKYFNNFSQKLLTNGLSNRERDVIRLLTLNKSSKEIAQGLNISPNTVDTHRRNILKKLNISSTGELIGMLKMNKSMM
ncbi:MAG: helix-turn-helix transcriptional regulator [Xanthomarina sp.]|uniref:response regulator transcription factor n=1 Tax=Xanthomarina sp. TaxID=1931211 RepID=UPI000C4A3707|nr:helix-turn-helix transcriptional regulator [Xanthomarina sp.]MAL23098.1 helix-turn-helix transcriptional regulator [Xanthomarina sp.]MBF61721.1 helix-turn-helix transcriptional regulator [Xanthomarina sp.]HAB26634.1 helix-turn-helix transcriptional regulator [Xanthomarina gelatinilytica]HAI20074.1 helix-turn-helix transcriptional regulator [Xanthomarina gelatinilytica]|tara:strand:- start:4324 stop:5094 length:771 start_codon:yes stop_codon:yes gene_type:complete